MKITNWSNGSGPEDFGWIIDGTSHTAYDLYDIRTEEEARKILPDELVDLMTKNKLLPARDNYGIPDWLMDNITAKG